MNPKLSDAELIKQVRDAEQRVKQRPDWMQKISEDSSKRCADAPPKINSNPDQRDG